MIHILRIQTHRYIAVLFPSASRAFKFYTLSATRVLSASAMANRVDKRFLRAFGDELAEKIEVNKQKLEDLKKEYDDKRAPIEAELAADEDKFDEMFRPAVYAEKRRAEQEAAEAPAAKRGATASPASSSGAQRQLNLQKAALSVRRTVGTQTETDTE